MSGWPPTGGGASPSGSGPASGPSSDGEATLAGDEGAATLGPTGDGTGAVTTYAGSHSGPLGQPAPAEGERIGTFVVQRVLGTGAMGVVVLALDPELDRPVAIKLLAPHYGNGDVARQRLVREAQAVARLSHPNVIAVHQVGTHGERVYMVMEYVDGGTLRQWVQAQPRSVSDVLAVYRQAAQGLAAAHAAGLVHRDFKPDNVLIGLDGRVRVSDFGLVAPSGSTGPDGTMVSSVDVRLTQTGAVLGTPAYMAPEQFAGTAVDARADQFSLCVALFEALYGVRPFAGDNVGQLYAAIEGGKMATPSRADVPASVHGAVLRGLAVEPAARHPSMHALAAALAAGAATSRPRQRAPVGLAIAGVVGVLAIGGGLGAWAWLGDDTPDPVDPDPVAVVADVGVPAARTCPAAADTIAGVWDDARMQALRRGYVATGLPYADPAAQRAIDRLDAYVVALEQSRHAVCEAPPMGPDAAPSPDLPARARACLDVAQQAVAGIVDGLADHPPAARVDVVPELLDAFPVLSRCEDPELLAVREPPPPEESFDAVGRARRRYWTATLLMQSGELDAAKDKLAEARAALEAGVYPPLDAELTGGEGILRASQRDPSAEKLLRAALATASEAEHPAAEAEAAIGLIRLVGNDPGRVDEALQLVGPARDALARAKAPHVLWALETTIAALYQASGRISDAEASFSRALDVLAVADPPKRMARAHVLSRRAATLRMLGRLAEARTDYERALELYGEALGENHPLRVGTLVGYATLLIQMNQAVEASAQVQEAERVLATVGGVHPIGVEVASTRALLAEQAGRFNDAIDALEEALARYDQSPSQVTPRAYLLQRLGFAYLQVGRPEEADRELERAVDALDVLTAPAEVAAALNLRGLAAFASNDDATAQRRFSASLTLLERTFGHDHPAVASAHVSLATAQVLQGNCRDATEHLRSALKIRATLGSTPDADLARIHLGMASCAIADDRLVDAADELDRADTVIAAHALAPDVQARAKLVRADLKWAEGDRAGAITSARSARSGYAALGRAFGRHERIAEAWLSAHPE